MTKQEAIDYCYKHEKEYKSDLYSMGENGDEQFSCLIECIEYGSIKPEELRDYGMFYENTK